MDTLAMVSTTPMQQPMAASVRTKGASDLHNGITANVHAISSTASSSTRSLGNLEASQPPDAEPASVKKLCDRNTQVIVLNTWPVWQPAIFFF